MVLDGNMPYPAMLGSCGSQTVAEFCIFAPISFEVFVEAVDFFEQRLGKGKVAAEENRFGAMQPTTQCPVIDLKSFFQMAGAAH